MRRDATTTDVWPGGTSGTVGAPATLLPRIVVTVFFVLKTELLDGVPTRFRRYVLHIGIAIA